MVVGDSRTALPRTVRTSPQPIVFRGTFAADRGRESAGINRIGTAWPSPQTPQRNRRRPATCSPRRPRPRPAPKRPEAPRNGNGNSYTAHDIEVLEGLEPVRRRPGMYIGGTDEKALHHLFAEVIDNAMDEALAGHATFIEVDLAADGTLAVTDNGRGIPVDPHPKFPKKSALEVIMCTLHAGGKFDSKVYETSGGLHGVGVSVVNALSERLEVEVALGGQLYRQVFARGIPKSGLEKLGRTPNRRGTKVRFKPDPQIFGDKAKFNPQRLFKMARAKAYLFGGVEIRWHCDKALLHGIEGVPEDETFHFPDGLKDYLAAAVAGQTLVHPDIFTGKSGRPGANGAVEWAVAWSADADGFLSSYCNTIPTADGGTHESGLRTALLRALKDHGERIGQGKRAAPVTSEDVMTGAAAMLSVFIREPEFQGQTKDRLATAEAARIVESAVKDQFDHWLAGNPTQANRLLDWVVERADERIRRRQEKEIARKSAGAQAAPARQARRLHRHRRGRLGNLHRRRRLAPAAPPSRRATARARRSCRCAARSSTSPAPARTSSPRTSSSPTSSRRSAAAPAPIIATRTCATRRSSS